MNQPKKTNYGAIAIAFLSSSIMALLVAATLVLLAMNDGDIAKQLEGRWVGTFGDDLQFMRAEFDRSWMGLSGNLHWHGGGELSLAKSRRIGDQVLLIMRRGDEQVVFTGHLDGDVMSGSLNWALGRMKFQLHRIVPVDRQLLRAYLGTYSIGAGWVRSIEDCANELGENQIISVNPENGARKALFPISKDTFFFGPGFLVPDPVEGTVTFLPGTDGRAPSLRWEQFGYPTTIAEHVDGSKEQQSKSARRDSAERCRPRSSTRASVR